jgi:hypothetical protein
MVLQLDGAARAPARGGALTGGTTEFERRLALAHGDERRPGGVVIHTIQHGEWVIKVGREHGYTLAEMQRMNLSLANNPHVIRTGTRLVILDRKLFDDVSRAVELIEEASQPIHSRTGAEEASALRSEARALLLPGFVAAGLPHADNEADLRAALDQHAAALAPMGRDTPGFTRMLDDLEQSVLRDLNELMGPLRPAIARARETGDWTPVRDAAQTHIEALTRGSADPETAVLGIGTVLTAAGPRAGTGPDAQVDPAYAQAIRGAQDALLVGRPVGRILDARNIQLDPRFHPPAIDPTIAPVLSEAEAVTADRAELPVSPERAAQILSDPEVLRSIDEVIAAIPRGPYQRGWNTIATLSTLTDRIGRTEAGAPVVDRWASEVVDAMEWSNDGKQETIIRFDWLREHGNGLRDAIAAGRSPAFGLQVVEELDRRGYTEEASDLLAAIGEGTDQQINAAAAAGLTFKQDVLYPAQVARPGFDRAEHQDGLMALVQNQAPVLERVDAAGRSLVLTRLAIEDGPAALLHRLPGAAAINQAYERLVRESEQEGSDLNATIRMSPSAAVEWARMVREGQRAEVGAMSDQALDDLLGRVRALPPDNPFVQILGTLGPDPAAQRAALRADPDLAIAMLQHLSLGPAAENGANVPRPPTGGFVIRMSDDLYHALTSTPATKFTAFLAATGVPEFYRPQHTFSDLEALVTLQFTGQLVNDAWGLWFAGNAWRAWQVSRNPEIAKLPGGPNKIVPIVGPILSKTLLPITLISTAEALFNGRPIEALAWIPGIIGSLKSVVKGAPKVSSALWWATAVFIVGNAWYNRVQASNHYEPILGAYLKAARPDVEKPESLANCDEDGRPFLHMLPVLGQQFGFGEAQLPQFVDWLYSLPVDKRDMFIDHALQAKPDDKGNYEIGRRRGDWEIGVREYGALLDPRIQRNQIETIADVVLFAEQWGYEVPLPR